VSAGRGLGKENDSYGGRVRCSGPMALGIDKAWTQLRLEAERGAGRDGVGAWVTERAVGATVQPRGAAWDVFVRDARALCAAGTTDRAAVASQMIGFAESALERGWASLATATYRLAAATAGLHGDAAVRAAIGCALAASVTAKHGDSAARFGTTVEAHVASLRVLSALATQLVTGPPPARDERYHHVINCAVACLAIAEPLGSTSPDAACAALPHVTVVLAAVDRVPTLTAPRHLPLRLRLLFCACSLLDRCGMLPLPTGGAAAGADGVGVTPSASSGGVRASTRDKERPASSKQSAAEAAATAAAAAAAAASAGKDVAVVAAGHAATQHGPVRQGRGGAATHV